MMRKILLNARTSEKRMALLEGNEVQELWIEQPSQVSSVGNIYRGRVINVVPGMQAAFLDIGVEQNGFIQRKDLAITNEKADSISSIIHQGQELLVQVTKEGIGTKGPKLTGVIELAGQFIVYLPEGNYIAVSKKISDEKKQQELRELGEQLQQEKEGFIFRTACEGVPLVEIEKEINALRKKWESILIKKSKKVPSIIYEHSQIYDRVLREASLQTVDEIIIDDQKAFKEIKEFILPYGDCVDKVSFYGEKEDLFSKYHIEADLEKILKTHVWLDNGASLMIEQTEAMTIIDVNTSKFTGKLDKVDTILKTNQLAAKEVARQLILRDIGGMIFIDFINMKRSSDHNDVLHTLEEELRRDLNSTKVFGFTKLGLVEMTRKRARPSLQQKLTVPCSACKGTGFVLSPESIAFKLERALWELKGMDHDAAWIEVPGEVKELFSLKHQKHLEDTLHFKIFMTVDTALNQTYKIRHLGSVEEIEGRIQNKG